MSDNFDRCAVRTGPPGTPHEAPVISTVRVEFYYRHARLTVWSRGVPAGTLVVDPGDAEALAVRLLPVGVRREAPTPQAR